MTILLQKRGYLCTRKFQQDLNFVDREKEVEKFWKDHDIFQKSIEIAVRDARRIRFMTDHRQPTVNHILATY